MVVKPEAGASWSLLQVQEPPSEEAHDGLCKCRFFHRYRVPNLTGYRCIKLGTVQTTCAALDTGGSGWEAETVGNNPLREQSPARF